MWPCNLSIEVYLRLRAKYVYYLFCQEYIDYLHCVGLFFLALRFDTKLMVGNLKQSYIRHEDFCPLFGLCNAQGTPPLDSETGWTGELWSNTNLLKWQN